LVRFWFCVVLFCLSTAACTVARGAVRAESPNAVIVFAPQVSPVDRLGGDFSIVLWIHPDTTTTDARSIFEIPGILSIGTNAQGFCETRLRVVEIGTTDPIELVATSDAPIEGGQWQLVVLVYRASPAILEVFLGKPGSVATGSDQASVSAAPLQVTAAGPRLGLSSSGVPALVGAYGLLVVRSDVLKASDAQDMIVLKRHFAPYDRDTSPNGSMSGPGGALWMLNHAVSTLPTDIDVGGARTDRAAVMGELVGMRNVHVYDDSISVNDENELFIMVRQTIEVFDFRYVSYRDPPLDGFFEIDPGALATIYPSVTGPSPLAAQLAFFPRRPIRVMVSSNSRAVFRDDGSLLSPGNYAHGFIDARRANTAGVFFRPPVRGWGGPWFGLDFTNAPLSTNVEIIDSTNGPYQHFSRFWTGSARAPSQGPGGGVFVRPVGSYEVRCRPEPGSLMTADEPLTVEAVVMAFPGASNLAWKPRRGQSQRDAGIDEGPTQFLNLNTETYTWTFHNDDRVINNTAFVLKGQHEGLIIPGDVMFISSGPGAGHLSIVKTVQQGITQATIQVTMQMALLPGPGSVLHFGPWRFERISYTFDPVVDGDPNTWRGLHLAPEFSGFGFPVFSLSAWRPDVPGYIFGISGWGGNGYQPQVLFSENEVRPIWMAESRTDLWLQVPAQQNTAPSYMANFTAEIRNGLPECEIVWAAEAAHPSGTLKSWSEFIVDNAAANGVVGISALNRQEVGSELEQLADGHRSNLPHINGRGNLKLAQLWCDLLAEAAIDPCPADFAPPWGAYDFFDLQLYLVFFAQQDPAADLTRDGVIDFFDIQAFLDAFASGCP
jgi:hypothetical protein